jgi:predicted O-methyltransferase YrrM
MAYPPGHFHSPIPALTEVEERSETIFAVPEAIPGIDLRERSQLELARALSTYYPEMPFGPERRPGLRYALDNPFFNHGDGVVLYAMLRHLRPARVVEVGSGHSSALVLDVNDRYFGGSIDCTFIEPNTERLMSLLAEGDGSRARIVQKPLQDAVDQLDRLEPGDFLFIDSSHVAKVGSDVNALFFEVLPKLVPGVVVHLHDIHHPFEYPKAWVTEGRAWNESYLLRAFLTMNTDYEILLFNSYLGKVHRREVASLMPLWDNNPGGSIWLRRARA